MLSELDGLSLTDRTARFRTVVAFVTADEKNMDGRCGGRDYFRP